MVNILSLLFILLMIGTSFASAPSRPNSYVSGIVIDPTAVTGNEIPLYTYLQSGVDTYAANSITNAAISTTAQIAYSKLNISNSILPADISTSATTNIYQFGSLTVPNTFTLNNTNQGSILYDNGTSIIKLLAGTSGQFLQTQGAGANPQWSNTGSSTVATALPSAASSFTISSLSPGVIYELVLNLTQNTSNGTILVQFNGDSGNNYSWGGSTIDSAVTANNAASTSSISVTPRSQGSGKSLTLNLIFETIPGNNNSVNLFGTGVMYSSSDSLYAACNVGGIYAGASSLASITISASAGTITGSANLYKLN